MHVVKSNEDSSETDSANEYHDSDDDVVKSPVRRVTKKRDYKLSATSAATVQMKVFTQLTLPSHYELNNAL